MGEGVRVCLGKSVWRGILYSMYRIAIYLSLKAEGSALYEGLSAAQTRRNNLATHSITAER